jgi:hypothetical protein
MQEIDFLARNQPRTAMRLVSPFAISPHYNTSCKLVICASLFFYKETHGYEAVINPLLPRLFGLYGKVLPSVFIAQPSLLRRSVSTKNLRQYFPVQTSQSVNKSLTYIYIYIGNKCCSNFPSTHRQAFSTQKPTPQDL